MVLQGGPGHPLVAWQSSLSDDAEGWGSLLPDPVIVSYVKDVAFALSDMDTHEGARVADIV
jgi:hypothetical protein